MMLCAYTKAGLSLCVAIPESLGQGVVSNGGRLPVEGSLLLVIGRFSTSRIPDRDIARMLS